MTIKIMLDKGARITKAYKTDAGYDLYAMESAIIPAKGDRVFDTGVHIELPEGTMGLVFSKSGLNFKHGITSEGIIDSGYSGTIKAKLYNNSMLPYAVRAGDKITQLIILPIITAELEIVDEFEETARGNNGFGSSGK